MYGLKLFKNKNEGTMYGLNDMCFEEICKERRVSDAWG